MRKRKNSRSQIKKSEPCLVFDSFTDFMSRSKKYGETKKDHAQRLGSYSCPITEDAYSRDLQAAIAEVRAKYGQTTRY